MRLFLYSATVTAALRGGARVSSVRMAGGTPYGSWVSPITARSITASSVGLSSVTYDGSNLFWLESRPQEGGRNAVVRHDPENAAASERGGVDATPAENNVRTRVHEYGGGAGEGVLQLECLAILCFKEGTRTSRTEREMITRPKMSRNE